MNCTDGIKHDQGKPGWHLMPFAELEDVVKVLDFGACKYGEFNWLKVPNAEMRYFAAAMRHVVARRRGELLDAESGLPHLAHAICCLLFMMHFDSKEEEKNEEAADHLKVAP